MNLVHRLCDWFRDGLNPEAEEGAFLGEGYELFFLLDGLAIFVAWMIDIRDWKSRPVRLVYIGVCIAIFIFGALLLSEFAPSTLLILGVLSSMGVIVLCRHTCIKAPHPDQFNFIISMHFFLISFLLTIFWILWAFTPALGDPTDFADIEEHFVDSIVYRRKLAFFILWASPVFLAITYFILGLFVFKRGQFHVPPEGDIHVLTTVSGIAADDNIYVGQELKFVFYCFVLLGMTAWIAASVAAQDFELSWAVLRISGTIIAMICLYLWFTIGPTRILRAAKEHPSVQFIMDMLFCDWMKAIFLTLFWPVLPLYFALEFVRQRVRKGLRWGKVVESGHEGNWLTHEGIERWSEMATWDWPSILDKSINVGVGYFVLQVGAGTGTTIFLAWLAEAVASWTMAPLLLVLFAVGLLMFLIPVVPGLPIYLVSGIVIVQKYEDNFLIGVAVGSLLCWAIKLCSNIVLMKCIGEPFADNVTVRMTVGCHTPTMRAAEMILTRPGLTFSKVAVLIGGPDWPTAVLCAMLKVPVSSMLVGISPVLVLIIPVVLAAAYTLEAAKASEAGNEHDESSYSSLATNFMMLSAVVQMGSMIVAGIFLHTVKVEHAAAFGTERPEDKPVIEAIAQAEVEAKEFKKKTAWELMPHILRAVLVLGSWSIVGMMYIVLLMSADAFHEFSLTNKVCDLKDCNPIFILKPLGFLSVGFLGLAIVCQMCFHGWCRWVMKKEPS